MRIALDLRWARSPILDGIGRVSLSQSAELLCQPSQHAFLLIFENQEMLDFGLDWMRRNASGRLQNDYQAQVLGCAPRSWKNRRRLSAVLRQWKADLYLSFYYIFGPVPCPALAMVHDLIPLLYPEYFRAASWPFRLLMTRPLALRWLLRSADALVTVSHNSQRDLQRLLRLTQPIYVCYPGVSPSERTQTKQENYLLTVGRPDPHKNFAGLIRAYAALRVELRARHPLYLVGPEDPRYTPDLKKLVWELGLDAQVRFLGAVSSEELETLYQNAFAFALLSLYEGFGLPPLEAMGYGVPVLAARAGAMPEVLGEACEWADPYDLKQVTQGLETLLGDPLRRRELKEQGRQRAAEFTWARSAQGLIQICETLHTDCPVQNEMSRHRA